jgi:hypothetical protein
MVINVRLPKAQRLNHLGVRGFTQALAHAVEKEWIVTAPARTKLDDSDIKNVVRAMEMLNVIT